MLAIFSRANTEKASELPLPGRTLSEKRAHSRAHVWRPFSHILLRSLHGVLDWSGLHAFEPTHAGLESRCKLV